METVSQSQKKLEQFLGNDLFVHWASLTVNEICH